MTTLIPVSEAVQRESAALEQRLLNPAYSDQGLIQAVVGVLRDHGWIVAAPPDPPRVGQVWRSANPRTRARTVLEVQDQRIRYSTPDGSQAGIYLDGWRAWAIRAQARPVPS